MKKRKVTKVKTVSVKATKTMTSKLKYLQNQVADNFNFKIFKDIFTNFFKK